MSKIATHLLVTVPAAATLALPVTARANMVGLHPGDPQDGAYRHIDTALRSAQQAHGAWLCNMGC